MLQDIPSWYCIYKSLYFVFGLLCTTYFQVQLLYMFPVVPKVSLKLHPPTRRRMGHPFTLSEVNAMCNE